MEISSEIKVNKVLLLNYFRSRANEVLSDLSVQYSVEDYKNKASAVNHALIESKDNLILIIIDAAKREFWQNNDLLECIIYL